LEVKKSEENTSPAVGSKIIRIEVPGFAFFLKPLEANAQPVVMV
jgi:hypothetical protein